MTHSVSLDRHDGSTVRKDRELVVLVLRSEDLHTRHRNDTSLDSLLLENFSSLDGESDFRSGTEKGDGSVLLLVENVGSLVGLLDRGTLELRKVLTGKGEDRRSVGGSESHVVGSGGLVTVCGRTRRASVNRIGEEREMGRGKEGERILTSRTPDVAVRKSTEVSDSLDRLVSRSILLEKRFKARSASVQEAQIPEI